MAYFITKDDGKDNNPFAGETILDGAGREVQIPSKVNSIVTFGGTDPLRFVSYLNLHEKVIECDKGDVTDQKNGRAYSYAYPYDKLETYHGDNTISSQDVERLGKDTPDAIIVTSGIYGKEKKNVDLLATKASIYILRPLSTFGPYWDSDYMLNKDFSDQITDLGKFLGADARSKELIDGWNGILDDIRSLMTGAKADLKTYASGLTYSGSNELTTTFPFYAPLELIGESNVVEGEPGRVNLTVENFAALDFNTMVVDPSSSNRLSTHKSQMVMKNIFEKNSDANEDNDIKIYAVMPIVWDGCNWDCSLLGTYMMIHLYYGSITVEQVKEKINAGFEMFYEGDGKNILNDMTKFFEIKLSGSDSNTPLLGEMVVKYNETIEQYYFAAA